MARAVRIKGAGGVEVLGIEDFEPASPTEQEVLIEVAAAGLNRADCLQRRGFYPAPKGTVPHIPGLEFAGTVCETGPAASKWKVGAKVMGICAGGAMATHMAVNEDAVVRIPSGMELQEAAALPEVFFTAFDALEQGHIAAGSNVLIHAVGSGVGTAAVQLVRRAGATSVGSSRSETKLVRAQALGLDHGVHVQEARFAAAVRQACDGKGADIVLDFIGAAYLGENMQALAPCGRLIIIGLLGGISGNLPLGLLLAKRASIIGTVLRSRSLEEKIALTKAFAEKVLPGFDDNELAPVIDRVMPMQEIAAAHNYMESNQSFGKIVMTW